jgi:hypothetical protein
VAISLAPILKLVKDYAAQELWGIASAVVFRFLKTGKFNDESATARESSKARAEGAMYLTPEGWERDKTRWNTKEPIRPR